MFWFIYASDRLQVNINRKLSMRCNLIRKVANNREAVVLLLSSMDWRCETMETFIFEEKMLWARSFEESLFQRIFNESKSLIISVNAHKFMTFEIFAVARE